MGGRGLKEERERDRELFRNHRLARWGREGTLFSNHWGESDSGTTQSQYGREGVERTFFRKMGGRGLREEREESYLGAIDLQDGEESGSYSATTGGESD